MLAKTCVFKDVTNPGSAPMQSLNFPTYPISLRSHENQQQLFDVVRKRWITFTPEEWVRQHLIWFLHHDRGVPFSLMGIEKKLVLHGMIRRSDVVVYDRLARPVLLCECKADSIPLTQDTMDQAARYNITLRVPLLLITNGLQHYCCRIDFESANYSFLDSIPSFTEMGAGSP